LTRTTVKVTVLPGGKGVDVLKADGGGWVALAKALTQVR
jgi:hypothetical protein